MAAGINTPRSARAFTLVELAIVLVIVGLIAGGVLVGRDLIRTAELRSILSDIEQYDTAANLFREKYNALPGDMNNATSIWGAADADPALCIDTVATGTQTCNGNGNERIFLDNTEMNEHHQFWRHLSLANLIKGTYTGEAVGFGGQESILGVNVPQASVEGVGYSIYWQPLRSGDPNFFDGKYQHIYVVGGWMSGNLPWRPAFDTVDAHYMDEKRDDGLPASGIVRGFKATSGIAPGCATADDATATYDLDAPGNLCTMLINANF